jgi:hypothetical protein
MRKFARTLMAGENILFIDKPATKMLVMYEAILAAGGFVVLFLFVTLFSDLPIPMKAAAAVVFSLAACGILHFAISTCTYIITDRRLLVCSDLNGDLKDSCELDEITGVRRIGFGQQLVVERTSGNPIRLISLKNRDEAERVIIGE